MAVDGHDGGVAALGDDHSSLAALGAGDQGQASGDEGHVGGVPRLGLCPGPGLGLVAEEEVHQRHGLGEDGLEGGHLHQEGGRQVHAVEATIGSLLLGGLLDGVRGDGGEEASAVDHLCSLDDLPVLRGLAVVHLVVVGGVQVRAEGSLDAHNQGGAGAGGGALVLQVESLHSVGLAGLLQLVAVLVGANAAHVGSGVGLLEHPLGHSDGVLSGTTGDVLDVGQLLELLEEGLVLLLSQDGVAGQELVLLQHVLAHLRGDVQERVAHAQQSHDDGKERRKR
mmetsp:Transcript_94706/g.197870  ORF Transcript_94706/g.197870 Transcript_94706/m.197870 type:complete len:281 (-) Transcript_94706:65-907(-)